MADPFPPDQVQAIAEAMRDRNIGIDAAEAMRLEPILRGEAMRPQRINPAWWNEPIAPAAQEMEDPIPFEPIAFAEAPELDDMPDDAWAADLHDIDEED